MPRMIICFLAYLLLHFLLYALVLRRRPAFRRELPIFLYHVLPAILVGLAAAGSTMADPSLDRLSQTALVLAVQGIYSLSFLELWSLAQGGFSIHILMQMESGAPPDLEALGQFGASKKPDRLRGLRNLGLIRPVVGGFVLTGAGRLAAGFLNALRKLAHVRESG